MGDWPDEGRITVVPLRPQMQSEPGTSLGTPYCCSRHSLEARTADSTNLLGCHRPVRFFHGSKGWDWGSRTRPFGSVLGDKKAVLQGLFHVKNGENA
jgi:hypothetical protein